MSRHHFTRRSARFETDEAKRGAMYAEMQQLLHDEGGQIVMLFNNYVSAHSKKIVHGDLNSNLDHDGTYKWRDGVFLHKLRLSCLE